MRFFKIFSIILTILFIILALTYSARLLIINNAAKAQLSLAQLEITCLDFSLTRDLVIIIDKLCLQSPKADIEITDITIRFPYLSPINKTDISVNLLDIKGTEHLFANTPDILSSTEQSPEQQTSNHQGNSQNFSLLLTTTLRPYLAQIAQLQLPVTINVAEISYSPFTLLNKAKTPYSATLSADENTFSFSLRNSENSEFLNAKLVTKEGTDTSKNDFTALISSDLNLLKEFASNHQLPITPALQNALSDNKISGSLDLLINYQADSVTIDSQITNLVINSEKGIGESGVFKLNGTVNLQSQLHLATKEHATNADDETPDKSNSALTLTFADNNEISLKYSQVQLLAMLEQSQVAPAILSLLKGNPLAKLRLSLPDNATLTLDDKQLNLSSITINAVGDERAHQLQLNNIAFVLPSSFFPRANTEVNDKSKVNKQADSTLVIDRFILDSQVKLTEITQFTKAPIALHLVGLLQQTDKETVLKLTENSSISANNILLTKSLPNDKQDNLKASTKVNKVENSRVLASLKSIVTTLTGSIVLTENKEFNINLAVHGHASQINIPQTLQLKTFDVFSEINGNLDSISLNATTSADGINLGSIVITGPVLAPKVQLAAHKLQLTDLLSLNIQLPAKIELIDGLLDYSVSGQLTDLTNIENTPFSVSIAVTSASGDFDGIWLQELNWHQNFTLLAGRITTQPNEKENLTIALIDTPTPISKLSINTNWTFNKSFKLSASQLKADALGGSFSIPTIQWPFEHEYSVDVQLSGIDLAQVVALDKKQGIVVTGKVSGQLPVTFDGKKYTIESGELHNVSKGLIQVFDNPAVAELKANNTELKLAFDALQNLHYHQLSSAISMGDDGYMLLETVIKGRNPDIDNDVNLNLNLSYDLLGLLESLSITQRFEESIIDGLQQNKE